METFDIRARLAGVRTRLVAVDARLSSSVRRRATRADGRLRGAAARLDSLSPLAVLGRGYAVCWNDQRTRIIRDAAAVAPGDVVRVTLERGELECADTGTAAADATPAARPAGDGKSGA